MAPAQSSTAAAPPTHPEAVLPRLTRLELIGFKSFAAKTVFQFERGITAVVGPNGSGKSNIADAVRWALGETSYSSLRSKKTEDVIFAGGAGKAPAGMAEVTLTFDNATSWLPIDFTEVTVTRRAFRSGETAYLINGRKVRLKDIHRLTASLGQSYTVVGQGLVDAALSQRAEERRGLFEHAADLTGLRLKAAEAERNLAETQSNTARLTDLLAEVEPRLRSLERAARQANEYRDVRDRLRMLQRGHFRRLLLDVTERLAAVEQVALAGESSAETVQTRHDGLTARAAAMRTERDDAADVLEQHRAGLQATAEQLRRVLHEREIAGERLAALVRRREDMAETQQGLEEQITGVLADLEDVRAQLAAADASAAAAREERDKADAAMAAERSERAAAEREHARLLALVTDRERQIADASRRKALLVQRAETDAAERERSGQTTSDRRERLERLNADISALHQAEAAAGQRLGAIDEEVAEIAANVRAVQAEIDQARETVRANERATAESSARLRELRRIHESGAGLFAGVRAVVQGARSGKLSGVRGTLAELIQLPAAYDTAMEVALGGHIQDIVVETWADAETAIRYLKKENAGRATFQPIDTVRGRRPQSDALRDIRGLKGVHGVASELLTVPGDLEGIVNALLGRSLVVDDLDVARACLPHLPSGWNAVTLTGEIARTVGSVTGGAAVRESGALGRERELRELPDEIAQHDKQLGIARTALTDAETRARKQQEHRQQLEAERSAIVAARREREQQRNRIAGWVKELDREEERARSRSETLDREQSAADANRTAIEQELARLASERDAARSQLDSSAGLMSHDQSAPSGTDLALREAQRQLATHEERLNAERRRESALTSQHTALLQERSMRAERAASVEGEIAAFEAQVERLTTEVSALQGSHDTAAEALAPLSARHAELLTELAGVEQSLEDARADLIDVERRRGLAGMDVERIRGELSALNQRIVDELELDKPNDLLADEIDDSVDERDSGQVEQEIGRLKDRLRRVGYAGENAVEDYERERERHTFLREQLDDVEGAAAAIRQMLDDVRQTMHERFEETFSRVSVVFSQMFSTLFGGGSARLVMVADEDGDKTGGIDIVAQPPGKRLQSLALLSGGERALTGVALLFAILKVNPTPFCLLDEVDAALDEANVVRFRDQLTHLANETQAIIITHNRGTIEVADTLYGVSMREDGTSTVLSLRLSDVVLSD
ncbi:MAG TPA: chromosome segregation protein SMC [Thermomicrobiales bacterium]|nr:chromosome segregation protein SMC [Thermomicrobiales bacterium]